MCLSGKIETENLVVYKSRKKHNNDAKNLYN